MKYLAVWKEVSYPFIEIEANSEEEAAEKAEAYERENGIPEDYLDNVSVFEGIEEARE